MKCPRCEQKIRKNIYMLFTKKMIVCKKCNSELEIKRTKLQIIFTPLSAPLLMRISYGLIKVLNNNDVTYITIAILGLISFIIPTLILYLTMTLIFRYR